MSEDQPSILFRLDPRSGVAPYRQLVDQVRQAVETGRLRGGDQLPSVREVVTQVTINPNTVHRAYRELEHLALAEGRLGLGTFITENPEVHATEAGNTELSRQLQLWAQRARTAGLDEDDMLELLRRILSRDERVLS
ncbi:MAG TPA: GntR family transcriptional regulator [Acidimicrobiales bacterium]|nr:GntR family transcriptional regulator [Acidimicrobiales bacterium]HUX03829.1 GntR family transcriptional regulator [Acidimicrobiales bacterium]